MVQRVFGHLWTRACTLFFCVATAYAAKVSEPLRSFVKSTYEAKVYTYDLGLGGLQPPLASFSPDSLVCSACPNQSRKAHEGTDLCNYGYGKPEASALVDAAHGLVWSNKDGGYSLATHVHHRLLHSKHRTDAPADADLFFIPLYTPQLCRAKKYDPMVPCGVDFPAYANFTNLWLWLLDQPSFQQSDGSDHFVILAKPWNSITKYCKVLSLEGVPAALRPGLRAKLARMHKLVWEKNAAGDNVHAVPHSTSFHYIPEHVPPDLAPVLSAVRTGAQPSGVLPQALSGPMALAYRDPAWSPWEPERMARALRPLRMTYVGSSARGAKFNTEYWHVKRAVAGMCEAASDCFALLLDKQEESLATLRRWPGLESVLSSQQGPSPDALISLVRRHSELVYALSEYCLTPPGDAATRRGLFDALILGCVPVVFFHASVAYPWHLPRAALDSVVVFVAPSRVREGNGSQALHQIRSIRGDAHMAQRAAIAALATSLQYSLGDLSEVDHERVGPDALDVIIGRLQQLAARGRAASAAPARLLR